MEPPRTIIREAGQDDLEAIILLYDDMLEKEVVPEGETLKKAWGEILTDQRLHLFILEYNGVPASTCILDIVPNLTWGARPYGLIENVVTKKEFRRQGLGRMILEYALGFSWGKDCYKVMLLTGREEEYIMEFYEKSGFIKNKKKGLIAINPEYLNELSHP